MFFPVTDSSNLHPDTLGQGTGDGHAVLTGVGLQRRRANIRPHGAGVQPEPEARSVASATLSLAVAGRWLGRLHSGGRGLIGKRPVPH